MIALVIAGVGFIVLVAIVVGIVDAARAPSWRQVAADRREQWEARQHTFHGVEFIEPDDDD